MNLNQMPRPLKFNSMEQFVYKSNGFDESYRSRSPRSGVLVVKPTESFYNRYNVINLILSKVNKNHLQVLSKNIVLNEEDIHPVNTMTINQNMRLAQTMQQKPMRQHNNFLQTNVTRVTSNNATQQSPIPSKKPQSHTTQGFYPAQQKPSKQFSQNQLLFNFNKIAEQKKAKKKQFLQTIEAKLNQIQLEAKQLEDCQFQEGQDIRQIEKIHHQINRQLTSNSFAGRVTRKVAQVQEENDQQQQYTKPQSLHINMTPVQINHVLEKHFDENQRLLDEVIRVKSKSREKTSANNTGQSWNRSPGKQFQRTGARTNSFNKTSVSSKNPYVTGNQKKIAPVTMKFPPKHGRK